MLTLSNDNAQICVVGRTAFQSGIGSLSYATAELLARNFPVCFLPTEPHMRANDSVTLPNGRVLPICKNFDQIKVSFFCDVLWNGMHDFNYALVPSSSLKYVWFVFDSDGLPPRWCQLMNEHFDLVIVTSPHLEVIARANGIDTPIATVPLPLDLDTILSEELPKREVRRVRFGCIAAFHPRKGIETLVEAFLSQYAGRTDVELVLHSNLAFGSTLARVRGLVARVGAANVLISHEPLTEKGKNDLIRSIDVFVNCSQGEGYSIGPREALAYGKALVLSGVGGHLDMKDVPGVFMVTPSSSLPARYPEIDNLIFGEQKAVDPISVARALESAWAYVQTADYEYEMQSRRDFAYECSFTRLSTTFASLIDPSISKYRTVGVSPLSSIPSQFCRSVTSRLGYGASQIDGTRRHVCAAYDAGFFSIFNAFMSHLVWQQQEERCHAVLPDWDIDRLIGRLVGQKILSFCYGQLGEGNLWVKFFQPLYGATAEQMQDAKWLWQNAEQPEAIHNEIREPLMTYIHAFKLYQTREFVAWRRQYHRHFSNHVHLRPELANEIDDFSKTHLSAPYLIAAHVRHPSHTVEQPGSVIANTEAYVRLIYQQIVRRGLDPTGKGWTVFLATDQEHVVSRFQEEFGEHLAFYPNVRRTHADEDAVFNSLSKEQQNRDGHQLQHLVAANQNNWSSNMAWEVIRDAFTMARCHCLFHVVSNVSTAVSYINPDIEMIFCCP